MVWLGLGFWVPAGPSLGPVSLPFFDGGFAPSVDAADVSICGGHASPDRGLNRDAAFIGDFFQAQKRLGAMMIHARPFGFGPGVLPPLSRVHRGRYFF